MRIPNYKKSESNMKRKTIQNISRINFKSITKAIIIIITKSITDVMIKTITKAIINVITKSITDLMIKIIT